MYSIRTDRRRARPLSAPALVPLPVKRKLEHDKQEQAERQRINLRPLFVHLENSN
jgi:hypothetical protein